MKFSHAGRIVAQNTVFVLLVRSTDENDNPVFAYVAVRADNLEVFIANRQKPLFQPAEFGIVIESGYGEPSDEIKERMTKEFGFNHEKMIDLPNEVAAANVMAKAIESVTEKPK